VALVSRSLRGVPALEPCSWLGSAHIALETVGPHIPGIRRALLVLDGIRVDPNEVEAMVYGPPTAAAILACKKKRKIINPGYQTQADKTSSGR